MAGLNESLVPKKALTQKIKEVVSNLAFLYTIDPIQMKNIILGAINENSEIDIEELRKGARDWYQYVNQDQLPNLIERTQPSKHQVQIAEPKTQEEKLVRYLETTSPLQFFKDLSGGGEPSRSDIQIVEDVMFKQKLLPGVINVLIHFVMLRTDMKFTKGYVEKLAGHWARKQVKTVKEAMELAKKEHNTYVGWGDGKKSGKSAMQKPIRTEVLPDWFDDNSKEAVKDTSNGANSELEAKKRAIEEKLKAFRK
jgi:replication initiation and membrane attachment protein